MYQIGIEERQKIIRETIARDPEYQRLRGTGIHAFDGKIIVQYVASDENGYHDRTLVLPLTEITKG
jgi:hypothetical protein